MPLPFMIPSPSRQRRPRRSLLSLGLIAIFAMVVAGPAHLWLAHGTVESSESGAEMFLAAGGCHGLHCSGHGHGPAESEPEDSSEVPTEDTGGGCDTCVLVASSTPLSIIVPLLPDGMELVDVLYVRDWNEPGCAEALVSGARGPPRSA